MTLSDCLSVTALLIAFIAALLALKTRREAGAQFIELSHALTKARTQADENYQEVMGLAQLVKRQLSDGEQQKQRLLSLQTRFTLIESLEEGQQALVTAKTRLADGQSLTPMVKRGAINASEAHLLSLLHRQANPTAAS